MNRSETVLKEFAHLQRKAHVVEDLEFLSIYFTAITLSMTFSHFIGDVPQTTVQGRLYMTVQHTLYLYFGWVGAFAEFGAVLFLQRLRPPS